MVIGVVKGGDGLVDFERATMRAGNGDFPRAEKTRSRTLTERWLPINHDWTLWNATTQHAIRLAARPFNIRAATKVGVLA